MARRNHAGSRSTRKSSRGKQQQEQQASWPGKVARKIRSGIKKLVG